MKKIPDTLEAWADMREGMWNALAERLGGHPGLAFFEQVAWKSHDEKRCHDCGAPGTVRHDRPMLAQAIPYYWMCDECEDYYREHVGGEQLVVGLA